MVDETGSARRLKVADYPGHCERQPVGDMAGELMAARCQTEGGAGTDLRFVLRQGVLNVLEASFDGPDDERAFEQRHSFPMPSGAAIEVEPEAGTESED